MKLTKDEALALLQMSPPSWRPGTWGGGHCSDPAPVRRDSALWGDRATASRVVELFTSLIVKTTGFFFFSCCLFPKWLGWKIDNNGNILFVFFKPSPQNGTSMLVSSLPQTCIVMVWTFLCVGVCEAGPSLSSFLSPPRAWRAFGVLGGGPLSCSCACATRVSDALGGGPQPLPSHLNQSGAAPLHGGAAPPLLPVRPAGRARGGRAVLGIRHFIRTWQGRGCWPGFAATGALGWRGGRATISNILLNVGEPNDTFKTMTIIKTKCIIS